jgi:putative transposase
MAIEKELLDQLLAGRDPNEIFAKDGLLDDLKKSLSERILNAELDEHLDGERVEGSANRRLPVTPSAASERFPEV